MSGKRNGKTILIIEDNADIQNFISRVLELEGYQVDKASDGKTGMEIIRKNHIDLILLDLLLPGPDGWSILRAIKRNPELSRIPVIVITAIAESTQRKKTLRMGAANYLVKPLSAHSLIETITGVFHHEGSRDKDAGKSAADHD